MAFGFEEVDEELPPLPLLPLLPLLVLLPYVFPSVELPSALMETTMSSAELAPPQIRSGPQLVRVSAEAL